MEQSCCQRRIEWSNPVVNAGLSGAILLPDLRRWPGDGFFGQKSEVGIPTSVGERSRNSDLGVEQSRNSDLGRRRLGRVEASMPGRNVAR